MASEGARAPHVGSDLPVAGSPPSRSGFPRCTPRNRPPFRARRVRRRPGSVHDPPPRSRPRRRHDDVAHRRPRGLRRPLDPAVTPPGLSPIVVTASSALAGARPSNASTGDIEEKARSRTSYFTVVVAILSDRSSDTFRRATVPAESIKRSVRQYMSATFASVSLRSRRAPWSDAFLSFAPIIPT